MQAHAFLAENALNPELEFAGKKKNVYKSDQTHTRTHIDTHSKLPNLFVYVCSSPWVWATFLSKINI